MSSLSQMPLIKGIWHSIRKRRILKKHRDVALFWQSVIKAYDEGRIPEYEIGAKQDLDTDKIIWQYWGQGFQDENLPQIVSICKDSVDRNRGEYKVIRLDDASICDYLDLPNIVWEKLQNFPEFNRTFFSDLLRVALLKVYGGVWLDATIYLSGPLTEHLDQQAYFVYQRDPEEKYKRYWEGTYAYYWSWHPDFKVKMLSSIMFARKENEMFVVLLTLLLHYWYTEERIIDYFFFQILYEELVTGNLAHLKCPITSDVIPHQLQSKLSGGCEFVAYKDIFERGTVHKMSYFDEKVMERVVEVLRPVATTIC